MTKIKTAQHRKSKNEVILPACWSDKSKTTLKVLNDCWANVDSLAIHTWSQLSLERGLSPPLHCHQWYCEQSNCFSKISILSGASWAVSCWRQAPGQHHSGSMEVREVAHLGRNLLSWHFCLLVFVKRYYWSRSCGHFSWSEKDQPYTRSPRSSAFIHPSGNRDFWSPRSRVHGLSEGPGTSPDPHDRWGKKAKAPLIFCRNYLWQCSGATMPWCWARLLALILSLV